MILRQRKPNAVQNGNHNLINNDCYKPHNHKTIEQHIENNYSSNSMSLTSSSSSLSSSSEKLNRSRSCSSNSSRSPIRLNKQFNNLRIDETQRVIENIKTNDRALNTNNNRLVNQNQNSQIKNNTNNGAAPNLNGSTNKKKRKITRKSNLADISSS